MRRKTPYKGQKTSFTAVLSPYPRAIASFSQRLENFRTYILAQPLFLTVTRHKKPGFVNRYTVTVLVVLLISLFRIYLNYAFEENFSYIIFTLAVVISAWYGGIGAGVAATVLCILSGMFIFLGSDEMIDISNKNDQLRVILFLVQGFVISLLSETVQDATRWQALILESISDAFITWDRNMRFMYINRKAEEMLRLPRKELIGKRYIDLYPGAGRTVFYKNCLRSLRKQKTMEFELFNTQDERWYYISLYPSVDGVSCYYQDITRRKRIEKRLRESQLQFRRFVNANIVGVIVADIDGRILEANDIFLSMLGYTRNDLREGKVDWKQITPPEYRDVSDRSNQEVMKKGMVAPFVKEYVRTDGKRIHILMGKVLLNRRRKKILVFCLDISEQVELEKKKNEFISIASHELKTPLTTIKAFTQILLRQGTTNEKRSKYFLRNIDTQVNKLEALVNDLLDVSKIEAGKLSFQQKRIRIDDLVKKVVVDFQYTTQSHTIIKEGQSKQEIIGDEHRLEQVLINLISNAVKYSPDADKVIVRIQDKEKTVEIHVQDFGIGIAKEEQEKIFERFFRSASHTASDVTGFGLGLYITKEIVNRHNGKLWVNSTLGEGSTFTVAFPVARGRRK